MNLRSLVLLCLSLCVSAEYDSGEDETCLLQSLTQVSAQKSSRDAIEKTQSSSRGETEETQESSANQTEVNQTEDRLVQITGHGTRKQIEYGRGGKGEKKAARKEKKAEKKTEKAEAEADDLATAKATYWPTPIPFDENQTCAMEVDDGVDEIGVGEFGSFDLEIMMEGMTHKAGSYLECVMAQKPYQQQYRRESRAAFKEQKKHIRQSKIDKSVKRLQKKQARSVFKKEKEEMKKWRKEKMKAKFKEKTFPKIMRMLAPVIHKQMADADLSMGSIVESGAGSISGMLAKGIEAIEWLEYIISTKVSTKIRETINKIVEPLMKKIWAIVGKAQQAITGALSSALGAIPFVGGILAEAVTSACTAAFAKVKDGVNDAILKLFGNIADQVSNAVVGVALKPLQLVKAGIMKVDEVVITGSQALVAAGDAVGYSIEQQNQEEQWAAAAAAEYYAAAAQESIISDAQDCSAEYEAEEAADEAEDAADDDGDWGW